MRKRKPWEETHFAQGHSEQVESGEERSPGPAGWRWAVGSQDLSRGPQALVVSEGPQDPYSIFHLNNELCGI